MCVFDRWGKIIVPPILFLLIFLTDAKGQNFSIKSNLLYDATGTINAGIETSAFGSRRWTFGLSGNYNAWMKSEGSFRKHAMVQPEIRRWFCDSFQGHFIGFHALGGIYNIGSIDTDFKLFGTDFSVLKDHRCQGWFAGCGVGYGYALPLDIHWNLEFEVGAGYAYSRYNLYECAECGDMILENQPHHYFGLTKASITIAYVF